MPTRPSTTNTEGELTVRQWAGTAPTVLFLHGLGSTGWHASPLADALPDARVVAPDLRGRGGSSELRGPAGLDGHADDVLAVVDALGLDDVTLVGHSMGAYLAPVVAERLAEHAPARRVHKMVLLDGGLPPTLPKLLARKSLVRWKFRKDAKKGLGPWRDVDAFVAVGMAPGLASRPDLLPVVAEWVRDDLVGEPGRLVPRGDVDRMVDDAVDTFFGDTAARALEQLSVPTHLLAAANGATDRDPPLLADEVLRSWQQRLGTLTTERVQANHLTLLFAPEVVHAVAS